MSQVTKVISTYRKAMLKVAITGLLVDVQPEECCGIRALHHDHRSKAAEEDNGDLEGEHLDVELDEPEPGGRLE